jgi:hypothetical protein
MVSDLLFGMSVAFAICGRGIAVLFFFLAVLAAQP